VYKFIINKYGFVLNYHQHNIVATCVAGTWSRTSFIRLNEGGASMTLSLSSGCKYALNPARCMGERCVKTPPAGSNHGFKVGGSKSLGITALIK